MQLVAAYNNAQQWIWTNPDGLTPAQVAADLGTDGTALFALAAQIVALLNPYLSSSQQLAIAPAGHTVTSNSDGSVSLT